MKCSYLRSGFGGLEVTSDQAETVLGTLSLGCGEMTSGEEAGGKPIISQDLGIMVATFWRKGGNVTKVSCIDCCVEVGRDYAEIILLTLNPPEQLLFVISDDLDIQENMANGRGTTAAFTGFLLRDPTGKVIEQITTEDCKSVH